MAAYPVVNQNSVDPTARSAIEQIHLLITAAQRIQLVTHVDPDGDAVGSLLGLGCLLKARGSLVTLTCESPIPNLYSWLPGSGDVTPSSRTAAVQHDLVISLDCSDARRMGQPQASAFSGSLVPPLVNIDHHVTNTQFGTVNWIEPDCAATAQLVLALADTLGWEVSRPVALCLLTGIVTDTRGLRTSNVDAQVLRAVVRLTEAGAPLAEIARRSLDQRPLSVIRLWGDAIDRLQLEDGILWTEITQAMLLRWAPPEEATSGLSNFLAGIPEARVIAVFAQRDSEQTVDVGLRAAPGYDVSRVAFRLGGGGHPQASGCTLRGDLGQVRELVLGEIRRSLAEQAHESG